MKSIALLLTSLVAWAPTWAENPSHTVSAPGSAVVEAAADRIDVALNLSTERNSFQDAAEGAETLATRLRGMNMPYPDIKVTVDYDVSTLRQLKWSKGRKVEQQFRARMENVPEGAVQQALVRFIDGVLQLEPGITVERFSTSLSSRRQKEVMASAVRDAVVDARVTAEVMAETAGLRLEVARMVGVGEPPRASAMSSMVQEEVVLREGSTPLRAFTASGDSVATIRVPAQVFVVFAATPK